MKNIIFVVSTLVFSIVFSGCVNSGSAPQDVQLQNPDGKTIIIKDIYESPLIKNRKPKKTEIIKVFFPKADNMKSSIARIKIPSGVRPPEYKQTSLQIIYAISGGGKLLIDKNMIILKKGVMVYVPPNTVMSITNNVNKILELIVVTSPPFGRSQRTILDEKSTTVKVAKDLENSINSNDDDSYQTLSKNYKIKQKNKKILSIEEYRTKINKIPDTMGKDSISDLLKDVVKVKAELKDQIKKDSWSLKMPDSSKIPLKKLKKEQMDKLIPKAPKKAKKTSLKNIQYLTPQEQKVPIRGENSKPAKVKDDFFNNIN